MLRSATTTTTTNNNNNDNNDNNSQGVPRGEGALAGADSDSAGAAGHEVHDLYEDVTRLARD